MAGRPKNRRAIPHRFEKCGYTPIRNPDRKHQYWIIRGKPKVVYVAAGLSLKERKNSWKLHKSWKGVVVRPAEAYPLQGRKRPRPHVSWGTGMRDRGRALLGKEPCESITPLHSTGWARASAALRLVYLSTGIAASFCAPIARSLLR